MTWKSVSRTSAASCPQRPYPTMPSSGLISFAAQLLAQLLHEITLLGGQVLRHLHLYLHVLVSLLAVAFQSLPLESQSRPVLGARRDADLDIRPMDRAYPDLRAQHRLHDRDRNRTVDVQPLAAEEAIGLDAHGQDQVAGRSTGWTGLALAAQPNAIAVLGQRRDPHLDPPRLGHAALAATPGARLLDQRPAAVAARAG